MIKEVDFQSTIENAFLTYGASVAQERAIPDVRDMLKIGLRQGLYAQYSNKITYKDKFQKAQKSVAAAMAQSYLHGDVAMYDTFIRAARPWSYRYPLEAVQGNYGNPTSPDSHAASRYVEMKSAEIANLFFNGLKKNAIGNEYYSNYDDTEMIPSVFPSVGFWNIVNGCSGIAVALATSVPTFNLKEVNEALIKIIQNPNISFDEIYCAPDFPTGGTIINAQAVKESLKNGTGESIIIRADLQYFSDNNMIQATHLPYGVFTNTIIDQLSELVNNNENYGIEKVVDHTKKEADIRIYLSKGVNAQTMINKLYKDTSLENWYSINMVLLDQGRFPKVFGWREACDAYIAHIRQCKRNETQYELNAATDRLNIIDGLLIACAHIDDVITIIRAANDTKEASANLIAKYNFNDAQVKAILAIKLSSLTKLDGIKLNDERADVVKEIDYLNYILNDSVALDNLLIKILREVITRFGDDRRTTVIDLNTTSSNTQTEEEVGVMLFDNNVIRVLKKDDLIGGKKGKQGINIKPPKNATLIKTIYSTNLSSLAAFTLSGKICAFSLDNLEYGIDYSLYDIVKLQDESIILVIDLSTLSSAQSLVMVTKQGYIKKTLIQEYTTKSKRIVAAIKMDDNDELIGVYLSYSDKDKIFIATSNGYYNYYSVNELTATGRVTKGVRGIKLKDNNTVISAALIKESLLYKGILTLNSKGIGKITDLNEFSLTTKGTIGHTVMNLSNDCTLAAIYPILNTQKTIYCIANNKAVQVDVNAISIQGRATVGNRIIDVRNPLNKINVM